MKRTVLLSLAVAGLSWGQATISARSGLVNFSEGDVFISQPAAQATPPDADGGIKVKEVRPGERLKTESGRAEVLLNPGIFLRLDRNSSFRMIADKLTDSHVELEKGMALMEVVEIIKGNQVTVHVGKVAIQPQKEGVYEIDAETGTARVFEGQLLATDGTATVKLGRGRMASFSPLLLSSKFDRRATNELYAWSSLRSGRIAEANQSVANALGQGSSRPQRYYGMWSYYPGMGMFTYIPRNGRIRNPFGYFYYSPYFMWSVYHQPYFGPSTNGGYQAENASWGNRPSSSSPSAPAAVAASTGDIGRAAASAPPAAPAESAPRNRGGE